MNSPWASWQVDPSVSGPALMALVLYAWLYRRGARDRPRTPWPAWRAAAYVAGTLVVLLALQSPLDALADDLFWAHMLQHMLLLVVAPPLLVLGLPARALLRAAPPAARRRLIRPLARNRRLHRLGGLLLHPLTVFLLFNGILGLWHVPAVYAAALARPGLHILEHASFLAVGCLLWWSIVEPLRVWPADAGLAKLAFVVGCHLPMLLLGQLFLAFTAIPLYHPTGPGGLAAGGLTPVDDQRLGGGIMFGLDMLITFSTVSILFGRLLSGLERRQLALDAALAAREGDGEGGAPSAGAVAAGDGQLL